MNPHLPARRTHLFITRCWEETLGMDESEWRIKVQHVQSGQVRYFRAWTEMIDWMQSMLETAAGGGPADVEEED